jgi:magnesium-transporting ATPase (P-type)
LRQKFDSTFGNKLACSILIAHDHTHLMVTKGALQNVLAVCSAAETGAGTVVDIAVVQDGIQQHFEKLSSKGFRTLGLAYKNMESASLMSKVDEADMTFLGFLVLFDPPKANIIETIAGNSITQLNRSRLFVTRNDSSSGRGLPQRPRFSSWNCHA